jgi:hypothetical protein
MAAIEANKLRPGLHGAPIGKIIAVFCTIVPSKNRGVCEYLCLFSSFFVLKRADCCACGGMDTFDYEIDTELVGDLGGLRQPMNSSLLESEPLNSVARWDCIVITLSCHNQSATRLLYRVFLYHCLYARQIFQSSGIKHKSLRCCAGHDETLVCISPASATQVQQNHRHPSAGKIALRPARARRTSPTPRGHLEQHAPRLMIWSSGTTIPMQHP